MVPLKEGELLPHSFNLTLYVHPAHVGVINDFLQPADVALHRLADCHLIVKPVGVNRHTLLKTRHEVVKRHS